MCVKWHQVRVHCVKDTIVEWCSGMHEQNHHRPCKYHGVACWLPMQFWVEAINVTMYLINVSSLVPLNEGLLEEAWSEKRCFIIFKSI